MAVDGTGSLYVLSFANHGVWRDDPFQGWVSANPVDDVKSMTVDGTGALYVLSFANHAVWRLDVGQGWTNVTPPDNVQSMAIDVTGSLYVLSFTNGVWRSTARQPWVDITPAADVASMAVDNTGALYALGFANHGVSRLDPFQGWVAADSVDDVQSMAVDGTGALYVLSFANHAVWRLDVGQGWTNVTPPDNVQSMAVDATGSLYVLSFTNGVWRSTARQPWVDITPAADSQSMVVDGTGALYVLSFANHAVWRLDVGQGWTNVTPPDNVQSMAVDVTGSLYVLSTTNSVWRSAARQPWEDIDFADTIQSMVVDNTGYLFVLSSVNHGVWRLDPFQGWTNVRTANDAASMTVDDAGYLYVVSSADQKVYRYDVFTNSWVNGKPGNPATQVADLTGVHFSLNAEGSTHDLLIQTQTDNGDGTAAISGLWDGQAATGTLVANTDGTLGIGFGPSANKGLDGTISGKPGQYTLSGVMRGQQGIVAMVISGNQVVPATQTIAFGALANATYGDGPITLAATASSNLPVTYQVLSGPAIVQGNVLTITGAGTVTIEASQAGDGVNFAAATPIDRSFTVNKAVLTVTANNLARVYGQTDPVFTASISGFVKGDTLATSGVTGGATFSSSDSATSPVGSYAITPALGSLAAANYNFRFVAGTLTVKQAATTVALKASGNHTGIVAPGQVVTFTATVSTASPGAGLPTGTVTFMDGATVLGTATLNNGVATFQTAKLAAGNHAITAVYGGDGNFTGSASASWTETVVRPAAHLTLTSSAHSARLGHTITLTARVSSATAGAAAPSGTVTFKDGSIVLGKGTIKNGVVVFQTAKLKKGKHTLTAVYGGDADFLGSTSTAWIVTIG
jgi:hypothetical protein